MLEGIRGAGGIGGLKKVDRSQIRDRSGAAVAGGGGADTGPHGSGLPPAGVAPGGGMADALAAALQKRKEKVSRSGMFFSLNCLCVCFYMLMLMALQMMRMMMMIGDDGAWTQRGGLFGWDLRCSEEKDMHSPGSYGGCRGREVGFDRDDKRMELYRTR